MKRWTKEEFSKEETALGKGRLRLEHWVVLLQIMVPVWKQWKISFIINCNTLKPYSLGNGQDSCDFFKLRTLEGF